MLKMRTIVGLEVYALLLALLQSVHGVLTDEAKYLLNIPYPHPPLVRWMMSATEWFPFQEMLWRLIIATLVVQSVWFVWDMARERMRQERVLLSVGWLASVAVVTQAGTIMMAPFTAVQGLVFLWLLSQSGVWLGRYAGWIALFWLASLCTAYQAILFVPLVLWIFWRSRLPLWQQAFCVCVPVALLGLYSLSNPLALASMIGANAVGSEMSVLQTFQRLAHIWAVGGSVVLAVTGIVGYILGNRWVELATLFLVSTYVFLSPQGYYAILFTPLFVAGTVVFLQEVKVQRSAVLVPFFGMTLFLLPLHLSFQRSPAHVAMRALSLSEHGGFVFIQGSFGHEWQYQSPVPVLRYQPTFPPGTPPNAQAILCLSACGDTTQFRRLLEDPWKVWIHH